MATHHHLPLLLLLLLSTTTTAFISSRLGINYGQLGDNLPPPTTSLRLIRSINAGNVKLYDANPSILSTFLDTNLPIAIMVPNQLIPTVAANFSAAADWVESHLLPFHPRVHVRQLLVGNEILSDHSIANSTWPSLVPAMVNLRKALSSHSIRNVKVGTTLAMDVLETSSPPSAGEFRPDVSETVMRPMLRFLRKTRSFFFVDAYPYFPWSENPTSISLAYALMEPDAKPSIDPKTGLWYTNLLEEQLDAISFAMEKLGFSDIPISIAETGWPNAGDYDQIGANVHNAATYNRNLARWIAAGGRTPARGKRDNKSPAFVFSLYNEDRKPGPGTERHWGVFYPNGSDVYGVDLAGRTSDGKWGPLPAAGNDEPYKGKIWCVAAEGVERKEKEVGEAVEYACGMGNGTCDAIRPGGRCFDGESVEGRASYAFNGYWQQFRGVGGTCYFGGLAVQTVEDPSHGSCVFRSN